MHLSDHSMNLEVPGRRLNVSCRSHHLSLAGVLRRGALPCGAQHMEGMMRDNISAVLWVSTCLEWQWQPLVASPAGAPLGPGCQTGEGGNMHLACAEDDLVYLWEG